MKERNYWGSNTHSTANKKLVKASPPVLMKAFLGKTLPKHLWVFLVGVLRMPG